MQPDNRMNPGGIPGTAISADLVRCSCDGPILGPLESRRVATCRLVFTAMVNVFMYCTVAGLEMNNFTLIGGRDTCIWLEVRELGSDISTEVTLLKVDTCIG